MKKLFTIIVSLLVVSGIGDAASIEQLRNPRLSGLNANQQEMEALQFLYAYMPLADVTD